MISVPRPRFENEQKVQDMKVGHGLILFHFFLSISVRHRRVELFDALIATKPTEDIVFPKI